MILRAAEAENREENNRQQNQPNPEADAFAETLGYIDAQNDPDDEVDERDEHQDYPPTRPARDIAHEVVFTIGIMAAQPGCPARLKNLA